MKRIDDFVKLSIIGTERVETENISNYFEIDFSENYDKEDKLLLLSCIAYKYNISGSMPDKIESININLSEKEDKLFFEQKIINRIKLVISNYHNLLPEYLFNLISLNKVFPEYILPVIFEEGFKNKEIQNYLLKLVGKRGIWLAKQNNKWNYIFDQQRNYKDVWENENTNSRLSLLREIRKTDPNKAIELLNSSWKDESAQDKVKFLETLELNLSLDDEAFLEFCLNDKRSSEVRRKSADLLRKIIDSALVKRMEERFSKLIRFENKKGKETISFEVIDEPDKELLRDIGEDKIQLNTFQEIENFVSVYILNKIPLRFFVEKLQRSPEEIISIANSNKNMQRIIQHLSQQTILERNKKWAKIFLEYTGYNHMLDILDKDEKEKIILKKIIENPETIFSYILFFTDMWNYDFSLEVIKIIITQFNKSTDNKFPYQLYSLPNIAIYVCPDVYTKADKELRPLITTYKKENRDYSQYFDSFFNILQFRHDMLKEIKE